ncbi:hypothetical protein IWQ60_011309 [Tieghemiomyces parasiticus]|uniref:protein-L-isoaspartate(D-aspartate) O-methyltransferase n=1 Tax=Tieghemiomyces parasiticus TaxID=78921 RepID=A0A9W7ZHG9_9FUNG|nr:hypothetical protein IWQ60_011309 [Tieghemiomyces parasiticus]
MVNASLVLSPRVIETMRAVDRKHYVRSTADAYIDAPMAIGHGATISAPHMHATALEHLQDVLQPGMKALDVGCGSGYLTACMAHLVGACGRVVGVDHIPALVNLARQNIARDHPDFLATNDSSDSGGNAANVDMAKPRVRLEVADGRVGFPAEQPYDCIHVGAAAGARPTALISQLKAPGKLFAPVVCAPHDLDQVIILYEKDYQGCVTETELMGVRYVPLTDPERQTRGF